MKWPLRCLMCLEWFTDTEGQHCTECREGIEVRKALDPRTFCKRCGDDVTFVFVFDDLNVNRPDHFVPGHFCSTRCLEKTRRGERKPRPRSN